MDEKELLKKAFEYGNIPSLITYCFTEPCPMKDKRFADGMKYLVKKK